MKLNQRTILIATIALIFAHISSLALPSQKPNTEGIIVEFLQAVNSGNRRQMEQFTLKHFDENALKRVPLFAIVSLNMSPYYQTGGLGFELVRELPDSPGKKTAIIKNRLTSMTLRIEFPIQDGDNPKINQFIQIKPNLDDYKDNQTTHQDLINLTEQCLDKMVKDKEFSGTVLIEKDGKVLLHKAYGEANRSMSALNQTDTRFNIASVGKMFTAFAIVELERSGKLSFDDTLEKFVADDWLDPALSKKIKIKHLLTHTSGLGDYFRTAYTQQQKLYFRDLSDYKFLVKNSTLRFEPGSQFLYSNTGYLLLGVVIEQVTDMPYFEYLKKAIFQQAGMINTDGFDKDYSVPNRAIGYTKVYEDSRVRWNNHLTTRILKGSPSGGIYSTTADLLKFANYLDSQTKNSPDFYSYVFDGQDELNASFHSMVFFLSTGPAGLQAEHKGDGQGMNCHFKLYQDAGYRVIILSNYSAPAANVVATVIDQLIQIEGMNGR